jgi:hypothetical protein
MHINIETCFFGSITYKKIVLQINKKFIKPLTNKTKKAASKEAAFKLINQ